MPELIKGLNWDVPTSKVKELLQVRIDQCQQKVELFLSQAKAQENLTANQTNPDQEYAKFSTDQAENLRGKARQHQERVKMYTFCRDNLVKGAIYRLERSDLEFLGVIDGRNVY